MRAARPGVPGQRFRQEPGCWTQGSDDRWVRLVVVVDVAIVGRLRYLSSSSRLATAAERGMRRGT
jgi:hypothetical protein